MSTKKNAQSASAKPRTGVKPGRNSKAGTSKKARTSSKPPLGLKAERRREDRHQPEVGQDGKGDTKKRERHIRHTWIDGAAWFAGTSCSRSRGGGRWCPACWCNARCGPGSACWRDWLLGVQGAKRPGDQKRRRTGFRYPWGRFHYPQAQDLSRPVPGVPEADTFKALSVPRKNRPRVPTKRGNVYLKLFKMIYGKLFNPNLRWRSQTPAFQSASRSRNCCPPKQGRREMKAYLEAFQEGPGRVCIVGPRNGSAAASLMEHGSPSVLTSFVSNSAGVRASFT